MNYHDQHITGWLANAIRAGLTKHVREALAADASTIVCAQITDDPLAPVLVAWRGSDVNLMAGVLRTEGRIVTVRLATTGELNDYAPTRAAIRGLDGSTQSDVYVLAVGS